MHIDSTIPHKPYKNFRTRESYFHGVCALACSILSCWIFATRLCVRRFRSPALSYFSFLFFAFSQNNIKEPVTFFYFVHMFLSHTLSVFLLFRLFILVVKQNKTHTPLRLHDSCKYIDVKNSLVLSHKNTYILCSLRTCVYTTHWYLHMCRPEHSARILKRYIYPFYLFLFLSLYVCALFILSVSLLSATVRAENIERHRLRFYLCYVYMPSALLLPLWFSVFVYSFLFGKCLLSTHSARGMSHAIDPLIMSFILFCASI